MKDNSTLHYFKKKWMVWLPAIIGVVIYLSTFGHGFVLDDNLVITQNEHVREGVSSIPNLFTTNYAHGHQGQAFNDGLYRPLSLVSFAVEQSITGLNPSLSHLIQALLYGLLLVVLMKWLRGIFGDHEWVWWAIFLFALHPVHVEVVANLKSRDELLALLFFGLSALYFAKWMQKEKASSLLTSGMMLLLALFSKESAITYVATYPLMLWIGSSKPTKRQWFQSSLLLVPPALFLLCRQWVLGNMGPVDSGVTGLLQNVLTTSDNFIERIATASSIQWLYLEKLFFPFELASDYSYNAIPLVQLNDLSALMGLLSTLGLVMIGIKLLKEKKPAGFGILFYFVTISVVANVFILIGTMAAERFLFTASLGWCIAISSGIGGWPSLKKFQPHVLGAFGILFLALTLLRVPDWKNEYTLFTADVKTVPQSARAHYNAGTAANIASRTNRMNALTLRVKAIEHLEESIAIWPDYQDAYNNLGIVHLDAGNLEAAYTIFKSLNERFPAYSKGAYNLAFSSFRLQQYQEAEQVLERLTPNQRGNDGLFMLAESEGYLGKFEEAIIHFEELTQLEPNGARGYLKLGMAHAIKGNNAQAEQVFLIGSKKTPNEVEIWYNLGLLYYKSGRVKQGLNALQQGLAVNPNHERSRQLFGELQRSQNGRQAL